MLSGKGQIVYILDFVGHTVLVAPTQLILCSTKAALDDTFLNVLAVFW